VERIPRVLDNLKEILSRLSKKQQVILGMSTVFAFVGILLMGLVAAKKPLALLYSGLDEKTMAELVDKVDSMGIKYKHKNGALYIEKNQRDKVRLGLAKQGLPRRGQSGYELLDNISGFGTTSEMFEATYWRAKEGEIARTLVSMDEIEDARVHIAPQVKAAFVRSGNEPSSSVMIKMRGGASPDKEIANSIKYLVALAVRGMNIKHVTVIDATSGRVVGGNSGDPEMARIEKRIELEQSMGINLESLISAYVGRENVKVQVSVDLNSDIEITRQKIIDPESRVIISTSNSEQKETSDSSDNGTVSVKENIPGGDAGGAGNSKSASSQSQEKVNYEVSQTEIENQNMPGNINRLSVAVMVDGLESKEEDGSITWKARTPEELDAIQELVKSAIGFSEKRGDIVTVKSLEFVKPPQLTKAPHAVFQAFEENFELIIEVIALLLSIAGISFGVVRPILNMGGDSKHKDEIKKLRSMYEEQIQALLPEEIEIIEENTMQSLISEVEKAIIDDPEEALSVIRAWLHSGNQGLAIDSNEKKPAALSSAG
jgi:flagellar M-ring protein FliF